MEKIKYCIMWFIAYIAGYIGSIFTNEFLKVLIVCLIGSAIFYAIAYFWEIDKE
jgi:hypothetical protein